MKKIIVNTVLFFLIGLINVFAQNEDYTSINYPGSRETYALGINSSNNIVGGYDDEGGFKLINNAFSNIRFQGATTTDVYGINDSGVIVGTYYYFSPDGFTRVSGFFSSGNSLVSLDAGGDTYACGINSAGEIVGYYDPANSYGSRGFKRSINGAITTINFPGAASTIVYGINNKGDIVGEYSMQNEYGSHGFKLSNGQFTTIDYSGKYNFAAGINDDGVIVGSGEKGGFKYYNGSFTPINFPGATATKPIGINNAGIVVGYYNINADLIGFKFTGGPEIIDVNRQLQGFFLKDFDEENKFELQINWKGTPGRVRFQINDSPPFEVIGTASGASYTFDLKKDFPFQDLPSKVKITPINGEGEIGIRREEDIYVFNHPAWLTAALIRNPNALSFDTLNNAMFAEFNDTFPEPEYKAIVRIPEAVPFVGGELGISKAQATFDGFVSGLGPGSLSLTGESKFKGLRQELNGSVSGTGNFSLSPPNGLNLASANFDLNISGTVRRDMSLITAIPALAPLRRIDAVRWFTDRTRLRGELTPSVNIFATWKQDPTTRELVFDEGTGTIGLQMKAILSTRINDRISFQGWVSGGGSITAGTPAPYIRSMNLNLEAGAQVNIDHIFGGSTLKAIANFGCTYVPSTGEANCDTNSLNDSLLSNSFHNSKLELLKYPYKKFGNYESFKYEEINKFNAQKSSVSSLSPPVDSTIVSNVFSGAKPTVVSVGNNGKMILWVRQNTSLPVLQSTEIAWSYFDGMSWSAPAVIISDTRAEFSPVAGVDSNGNVVAAWLKIKIPSFNTPVPTMDDLPLYYKQMEVVSAVFNPATRTWSGETSLTNDSVLDTSLRIASDNGNLLLSWQSNPSGKFTADASNPGTLKYSFWNGTSWNPSAPVAGNLINAGEHTVALKGNNAFIVLPVDPDTDTNGDNRLLLYNWNGSSWSNGLTFAAGNGDNQIPAAVYDSTGTGKVIWIRGADVVQATLTNSAPQIIRQGSESGAFYNLRLLKNQNDNLALIWQEVAENGPANIFIKNYTASSNSWGDDRRLNQSDRESKDAEGFFDGNGKLQIAYLSTQILRVNKTVTINGQNYEIQNVPENGQTDLRLLVSNQSKSSFDFDGDGKTDISIFRPSNGAWWYQNSSNNQVSALQFGESTDSLAPADYTGDGKTDFAVFRPSNGYWYVLRSEDFSFYGFPFGSPGDKAIPADFDGDGKVDPTVFRPSNGAWYSLLSSNGSSLARAFGISEDIPLPSDYDGDGKADLGVFRPSTSAWWIQRSSNNSTLAVQFGTTGDKPTPADFTGDGKTDFAFFRPSNGTWYILRSEDFSFYGFPFGVVTDTPVVGDYDGDGKADAAVFRASDNGWYLLRSTAGFMGLQFGASGDKPVPSAFLP